MDYKSNHEFLKDTTRKLVGLLEKPEFGISTWHLAVQRQIELIADFYNGDIDYSKGADESTPG